jgi:hypothetical protein
VNNRPLLVLVYLQLNLIIRDFKTDIWKKMFFIAFPWTEELCLRNKTLHNQHCRTPNPTFSHKLTANFSFSYCHHLGLLRDLYDGLWTGRLDLLTPYTHHSKLQCYCWSIHTSQFTVTHALGFSVFTSRNLATDFITVSLSFHITHEVFFSQPNSFLAIILPLPIQFNSIPELPSPYPDRMASRNSTPRWTTKSKSYCD